jgi:hypothetical protein
VESLIVSQESNRVLICFHWLTHLFVRIASFLEQAWLHLTQPARRSLVLGTAADLTRSKTDLTAENAHLHQQLVIPYRQVKKPVVSQPEHLWLVLLASRVHNWRQSLLLFGPTPFSVGIARASASSGNSNREIAAVAPNWHPRLLH